MKRQKPTKKKWSAVAFVAVALALNAPGADTYNLAKSESSSGPYGFFSPSLWTPAADAFDSSATYIVKKSAYRLVIAGSETPVSFGGGLLQFGSGNDYGYALLYRQSPTVIDFANQGASFVNGGFVCVGRVGARFITDGTITLNNTKGTRRMVIGWVFDNCELRHKGRLVGETAQPLYVGGTNYVNDTWYSGCRLELAGDCSACRTPITLWTQNAETTAKPEVTLAVGGTTLPCLVTVSANGALATYMGGSPTIGAVSFKGNNWLECSRPFSDATVLGKITVTGAFSVANGPVKVVAPRRPPATDGAYPVLTFPAESAASGSDFTLAPGIGSEHCSLSFGTADGKKILSLAYDGLPVYTSLVYQTVASAVAGDSESWSDGTSAAESGKRYLVDIEAFGDDTVTATFQIPNTVAEHTFPGDALTLANHSVLQFESDNPNRVVTFNCKELNIEDSASVEGLQVHYALAGGKVNIDGTVLVAATSGRECRIRSELAGSGTLEFGSASSGSHPYGKLYLYEENTNFLGRIDTTLHQTKYATFDEKYQTLSIWHGTSIGGNLPALDRSALLLNHYIRLIPNSEEIEIAEESNRGVLVRNGAVISVADGYSFTVGTPVSLDGELRKEGVGTLTLKGAAAGFGADGSENAPTEGKNVFAVKAGTLRIGSADAINGMAVSFSSGTSLVLLPNFADPTLMRYGIRNVKTEEPYALDGAEALAFSVGAPSGTPPPPESREAFRLGLMTVPDSEPVRTLVRAAVQAAHLKVRGYRHELVEDAASEPGQVTFALSYAPLGFCVSIR